MRFLLEELLSVLVQSFFSILFCIMSLQEATCEAALNCVREQSESELLLKQNPLGVKGHTHRCPLTQQINLNLI